MKRLLILVIFGVFFCAFFIGCRHTLDKLTRVNTGNVDVRDMWEAFLDDEKDFQETYW
ncbi:hypothetical protein HQ550_02325 [bacterium]|nr:hypothetical protein [bacterium]